MRSAMAAAAVLAATALIGGAGAAAPAGADAAAATGADAAAITVELNKLEPANAGCRAYLVVRNGTDTALASLRLDLVMFGTDGVIARRLAVETAPLPAGKTAVRLFDMAGTDCADIARVLLNDVLACRDAAGDRPDCLAQVATSSRAAADFIR